MNPRTVEDALGRALAKVDSLLVERDRVRAELAELRARDVMADIEILTRALFAMTAERDRLFAVLRNLVNDTPEPQRPDLNSLSEAYAALGTYPQCSVCFDRHPQGVPAHAAE